MIVYREIEVDVDDELVKKYIVCSNNMHTIEREDGKVLYEDLIADKDEHTYIETDDVIGEKQDYETAFNIILGLE